MGEQHMEKMELHRNASEKIKQYRHDIVQELAGEISGHLDASIDLPEEFPFDWESHLDLYIQHFTQAIATSKPKLFAEFLSWSHSVQKSRDIPDETFDKTIELLDEVFEKKLDSEMGVVAVDFLKQSLSEMPENGERYESFIKPEKKHGKLAEKYFRCLLEGDRHGANKLILDAVEDEIPVKEIYTHVFQPCQYEIGRLWQLNEISVAQEHFCTAATQMIMSQLYTQIFSTERIGKSVVATAIGGDLHEIGIRMVSDFFEMEGWDTFYLGANSPIPDVIDELKERDADLLAISVTMSNHLDTARELIQSVRQHDKLDDVKIIIGGRPFNITGDYWKEFGADGHATHADEAIEMANELTT